MSSELSAYDKRIVERILAKRSAPQPPEALPPNPLIEDDDSNFTIDDLIKSGRHFYSAEQNAGQFIGVAVSLKEALAHAKDGGLVASMPYLVAGMAKAEQNNYLWKNWSTCLSEEDVGISKKLIKGIVKPNKPVLAVVHGGGVLRTYDRIMKAYTDVLTPQNAAKFSPEEFANVLEGKFDVDIPVYTVEEIKSGIENPFGRYVVLVDFKKAKATKSGYHSKSEFMGNELVIARAGTLDHLENYFEKAKGGTGSGDAENKVGSWHRFGEITPTVPQGRLLFVDNNRNGLIGYSSLDGSGRFVAVGAGGAGARK